MIYNRAMKGGFFIAMLVWSQAEIYNGREKNGKKIIKQDEQFKRNRNKVSFPFDF